MAAPMTPTQRLEKIIADGLCLGCGLCAAMLGEDALTFGRADMALLGVAGMRLKQAHMRTPDQVLPRRRLGKIGRKTLKIEPGTDVIDEIHLILVKRRAGKGARLTLVIATECQGILAKHGGAQPAPQAKPVRDDLFQSLCGGHGRGHSSVSERIG